VLSENNIKNKIIEIGKKLYDKGYSVGISGNISYKADNVIYITATCTCFGELDSSKIVKIDIDGEKLDINEPKPSSEKTMHVEIYKKRPEVSSIVHAHPVFSTTLAAMGKKEFPSLLAEPVVMFGKSLKVAPYHTPSTDELAIEVANYFQKSDAVFMANHGAVVCGNSIEDAFYKLETLEFYSKVYYNTTLSGKQALLNPENVADLLKLRGY